MSLKLTIVVIDNGMTAGTEYSMPDAYPIARLRLAFLLTLATVALATTSAVFASPADKPRVAVLEFYDSTGGVLTAGETQYLADVLRGAARRTLPAEAYILMTRENIFDLLPPDRTLRECAGACAVEIGRNLGARYVVTGEATAFGGGLRLVLQLYDTSEGNLLGQQIIRSPDLGGLESELEREAPRLVVALLGGDPGDSDSVEGDRPRRTEEDWASSGVAEVLVTFESVPPGALLEVDGRQVGVTPCSRSLTPGLYQIGIKKARFVPLNSLLEVRDGMADVSVTLRPDFGRPTATRDAGGRQQPPQGRAMTRWYRDPDEHLNPTVPELDSPDGWYSDEEAGFAPDVAEEVPAQTDAPGQAEPAPKKRGMKLDLESVGDAFKLAGQGAIETGGARLAQLSAVYADLPSEVKLGLGMLMSLGGPLGALHPTSISAIATPEALDREELDERELPEIAPAPRNGGLKVVALNVDDNAAAGRVLVGGVDVGATYTPITLLVGRHDVEVRSEAGRWSGTVTVVERELVEVEATLEGGVRPGAAQEGPLGITLVAIPAGTFTMGSPDGESGRGDDEKQHRVTLTQGFLMSTTEVTQEQYEAVVGENPSQFRGLERPVENVTWFDAVEFCNALSEREGLSPAYRISGSGVTWDRAAGGYRLPTEAEWEYACRAGTESRFHSGDGDRDLARVGWHGQNSVKQTQDVATRGPNAWRLHDMHGNVWEWCWDWYAAYSSVGEEDPMGPATGSDRVLRGGSWDSSARNCRSAYRASKSPTAAYATVGFRVVRSLAR